MNEATDRKKANGLRRFLMGGGIALTLLAGGGLWLAGGRYIATDNAYIKADIAMITPDVSGRITHVAAQSHQHVAAGSVLFSIDREPFALALAQADAQRAAVRTDIEKLKAQYRQKTEDLRIAQSDIALAQKNFDREDALDKKGTGAVSASALDRSRHDLETARQRLVLLQEEQAEFLAALGGDADITPEDHPLYRAAQAAYDKAALDLGHTEVRAPFDGVTGDMPFPGDYAHAGAPSLSLVSDARVWIEANYKETELTRMKPGLPAHITVDTYPGQSWSGRVSSISPATSAEFSILPAQNATGNWVKIVQRIPVRIEVAPEPEAPVLRAGMSTEVRVDTGERPRLPFRHHGADDAPSREKQLRMTEARP